jgi:hypothetical protein
MNWIVTRHPQMGAAEQLPVNVHGISAEIGAASGDQMMALRSGARGSVIYPGRTRAGCLREEYLLREPAKGERDRVPPLFQA